MSYDIVFTGKNPRKLFKKFQKDLPRLSINRGHMFLQGWKYNSLLYEIGGYTFEENLKDQDVHDFIAQELAEPIAKLAYIKQDFPELPDYYNQKKQEFIKELESYDVGYKEYTAFINVIRLAAKHHYKWHEWY